MQNVILYAALGLGAGALIASIALGVVLIYRGSGVINLAVGAIAMLSAYIFWSFRSDYWGFTLSTVPAFVLTLICMAVVGVIIELAIFRPLRNTSPVAKLAASLGLLLVLQAGVIPVFGDQSKSAPSVLTTNVFSFFGRVVPKDRFILAAVVILVAAALAAL
jgi:branched-chain amino acid transport system permease protein